MPSKENLNRAWVAAYRWGYRDTPDRPTYGRSPQTKWEIADAKCMRRFHQAVHLGHLPKPDGHIGRDPVWQDSTLDAFVASKNANSVRTTGKRGRQPLTRATDAESEPAHAA